MPTPEYSIVISLLNIWESNTQTSLQETTSNIIPVKTVTQYRRSPMTEEETLACPHCESTRLLWNEKITFVGELSSPPSENQSPHTNFKIKERKNLGGGIVEDEGFVCSACGQEGLELDDLICVDKPSYIERMKDRLF